MNKLILALLLSVVALSAQNVTASLSITFSQNVLADINTHWMDQTIGSPGTLAADLASTDMTVTLSAPAPSISAGTALLIDHEPMTVTAISGATLTVTRGQTQTTPSGTTQFPLAAASAHSSGVQVFILRYPSPWDMVTKEAMLPWTQQVAQQLGTRSATFSSSTNGSVN